MTSIYDLIAMRIAELESARLKHQRQAARVTAEIHNLRKLNKPLPADGDGLHATRNKHRYMASVVTEELVKLRKYLKHPPSTPDWKPATLYEKERARLFGESLPPEE